MPRGWRNHLLFYEQKKNRRHLRTEVQELSSALDLPDEKFLQNYKVSREMVDYLCDESEVDLAPGNADGLPVLIKVLKILINGRGVGQDQNLSIGQSTVSKYLQQFVDAVNRRLKPKWVVFPGSETSRQHVAEGFRRKFGLSDSLGAVDCTHVDIFPPKKPHNVQYINRHGNTSINVQLVADADCRLLNVNAEYPGRVHDQFIFTHSVVKTETRRLYEQRIGEYYLLGDSGYSLEPWLMTPTRDAPDGSPEYRYTQWHCQTRNLIERTNGYLKGTFRILGCDRSLHYAPEKASQLVYASCTLYNIMKYFRIPLIHMDEGVVEEVEVRRDVNARLLGVAMQRRQQIVQNYFL